MTAYTTVRVNVDAMRQPFHPCDPDFIRDVCQARCCRSTTDPSGIAVVVTTAEAVALRRRGATVDDTTGRIAPVARRCPFQGQQDHLCSLHGTDDKPAGCIISPFTVNANGTLIVRNRYRMLPCFKAPAAIPVAHAHRTSLERLFGAYHAARICDAVDDPDYTGRALMVPVDPDTVDMLLHKNEMSK